MRTRSYRTDRYTPDLRVLVGNPSVPTEFYTLPRSDTTYAGNFGPGCIAYSTITDESIDKHLRRPKACFHRKDLCAGFAGAGMKVSYPTPTFPAYVDTNMTFMHNMSYMDVAFPAAELMDRLASLVSGNVKTRLSIPIFLIEGAKTLLMLRNPFNLLKPDFRRRVRKLTAASLLAKGASIWLEQLFGWQQFKSDIDESAKALATFMNSAPIKSLQDEDLRLSVSSKQVIVDGGYEYSVGTTASTWNYYEGLVSFTNSVGGLFRLANVKRDVTFRLGCRQRRHVLNELTRCQQLLQLTGSEINFYNIRDILWEIVPFSFVIDWFVDTRSLWYIPNLVRLSNLDVKDICYSSKYSLEYDVDYMYPAKLLKSYDLFPWYGLNPVSKDKKFIRSTSPGKTYIYNRSLGFPMLDSAVTNVFEQKGLTWSQLTTGAALFAQRFFTKP